MKKILAIGEIIWDVYPDRQVIGGAPLNFAAHASLCGAMASLLSAVGNDDLGIDALSALADFGVDCKFIKKSPQPTGRCLVTLGENAIPHYDVLCHTAYDDIRVTDADIESINGESFDALYFGTLIQREPTSRRAVQDIVRGCSFGNIICDVNLRPNCFDEDSVRFCLENATILKVSIEEEPTLRSFDLYSPTDNSAKSIAQGLSKAFPNMRTVLITLGKNGSYVYDTQSHKDCFQGAVGKYVVSTVGAGDSFAAAFLTSYLEGQPLKLCMKKAAEISGFVVAHTEAVPKY